MKRYFPLGGIEEEWYARSMVEDKERGWTFLRHGYPPPAGMVTPAPAAPEDDKYEWPMEPELWEDDPSGVSYKKWTEVPKETYRVGQVWKMVDPLDDVDGHRSPGTLLRVIELKDGTLGLVVQSKDGKKSRHGLGLCWYAKLQRRKEGAVPSKVEEGQVWKWPDKSENLVGRFYADGKRFDLLVRCDPAKTTKNWEVKDGKPAGAIKFLGVKKGYVKAASPPVAAPGERPTRLEVGQVWKVMRSSEGHKAGDVLTVMKIISGAFVQTDRCPGDCGGRFAEAEYIGTQGVVPLPPKDAGLKPGDRYQRDFAGEWERFEVMPDGKLKLYETSLKDRGGVGMTFDKDNLSWHQFKKI